MNVLQKAVKRIESFPKFMQKKALSIAIGSKVKFVGTANVVFEEMTTQEVVLTLANKKKVRNHIGQIHAAATALLAETATGMVIGMNLPDDKIPLMKTMKIDFTKRSQGWQKAIATLPEGSKKLLEQEPKGELLIPVTVTDEQGTEVIKAEMLWAWIPKKKRN
ncbi:MAG: DUF4442 domain-containing protein [Aureispira sp.]|nr:DUF4442 domain-containing protein [Aureispira sp.]